MMPDSSDDSPDGKIHRIARYMVQFCYFGIYPLEQPPVHVCLSPNYVDGKYQISYSRLFGISPICG